MEDLKHVNLNFQPLTLVIPKEREDVYEKVKNAFVKANKMLDDKNVDTAAKLEVMRILALLAQCLLRAAKDIQTEELIKQLEGLDEK